jgi:vacuolar iron transporter family protein
MSEQSKSTRPSSAEFEKYKSFLIRKKENPLRDIILGGQDGLVNALGIILGVAAAGGNVNILIATVLAASAAESISMGAVAYTSTISQKDHYDSERRKVNRGIDEAPDMAREEVMQIFEKKGFSGNVLEEVATTITNDKKTWADLIMSEELGLEKVETKNALQSSVIVGAATAIGSIIPVIPFFLVGHGLPFSTAILLSIGFCTLSLFGVGVYQALTLIGVWWKSGIRMVGIGLSAAIIGYFIAKLFNAGWV